MEQTPILIGVFVRMAPLQDNNRRTADFYVMSFEAQGDIFDLVLVAARKLHVIILDHIIAERATMCYKENIKVILILPYVNLF